MSIETQALIAYSVSLALVILMKIVCFILGYLTIRLGYELIASGVKGEFKFAASLAGVKADLASVSPGLLFVLLGILLIRLRHLRAKTGNRDLAPERGGACHARTTRTTDPQ
jgi:hypothetical protein